MADAPAVPAATAAVPASSTDKDTAQVQQQEDAEPPAKLIKTEDGSAVPVLENTAGSAPPAAGVARLSPGSSGGGGGGSSSGGGSGSDDFMLNEDMENILVNFLVRMAFLIGEGQDKDPDMQVRSSMVRSADRSTSSGSKQRSTCWI